MKFRTAFFMLCAAALSACSTITKPEHLYEAPDYTQEDVRREEIKRIDVLLAKNPVQALWRATVLGDAETEARCFEAVAAEFEAEAKKKNWFAASRLYNSLKAAGYPALSSLSKGGAELERLSVAEVPGLSKGDSSPQKKVSSYIAGTVTIWVDKGVRIENGMQGARSPRLVH